MKRFLAAAILCLCVALNTLAQQVADPPATKADVERYLEVMHSRDMMKQMMDAMAKPMHQMIHEQFLKDKDKLPPDFEARMNKIMDEYMSNLPINEMLDAMIPAYQKHLSKGDIDALVAFYGTPTGQKLIKELPAMTAEAMQAMMPILRQKIDVMSQRVQEEVAQMIKEQDAKPATKAKPVSNN